MSETLQQRMARQRAAREARDGTPEEQEARRAQLRGVQAVRRVQNNAKKIMRLVGRLERSMGERLPSSIRNQIDAALRETVDGLTKGN